MSENVYVVGIDMIRFGRFPEKSVPELGAEAAQLALVDAGVKIQDIEALYCGNLMQASGMVGQRILHEIGQTGIRYQHCNDVTRATRAGSGCDQGGPYDSLQFIRRRAVGRRGCSGRCGGGVEVRRKACRSG